MQKYKLSYTKNQKSVEKEGRKAFILKNEG